MSLTKSLGPSFHDTLTKNQCLVMMVLIENDGPLSAYTILDKLRDDGFRAPLQVYRALDKLLKTGMVHRIESLNAFIACRHQPCEIHEVITFTICDTCQSICEISDSNLSARLKSLAEHNNFTPNHSIVELRGQCGECKNSP